LTTVAVRDLETGGETSRAQDTLTLDIPGDFPRTGGVFTVTDGFRASYATANGTQVAHNVTPRPLGWRAKGETCLIARTGGARRLRHYRLCRVAPAEAAASRDALLSLEPD
jgi:hypothetical protein